MRPFCRENMDYILNDDKYIDKMNIAIESGTLSGLQLLIEWKHFDKNHPENHNIKNYKEQNTIIIDTTNKNDGSDGNDGKDGKCVSEIVCDTIDVFTGKEWKTIPIKDAIIRMLHRLADDIDNFIGYMRNCENKEVDVKKFIHKIAAPLDLDMVYIEYQALQNIFVQEKKRDAIFQSMTTFLKKKLKNSINKK